MADNEQEITPGEPEASPSPSLPSPQSLSPIRLSTPPFSNSSRPHVSLHLSPSPLSPTNLPPSPPSLPSSILAPALSPSSEFTRAKRKLDSYIIKQKAWESRMGKTIAFYTTFQGLAYTFFRITELNCCVKNKSRGTVIAVAVCTSAIICWCLLKLCRSILLVEKWEQKVEALECHRTPPNPKKNTLLYWIVCTSVMCFCCVLAMLTTAGIMQTSSASCNTTC